MHLREKEVGKGGVIQRPDSKKPRSFTKEDIISLPDSSPLIPGKMISTKNVAALFLLVWVYQKLHLAS